VEVCFVCHGVWFDKDELEKIIEDGNKALSDDVDMDSDYQVPEDIKDLLKGFSEKRAQCPKCQDTVMKKESHYGVMIDACPKCGGVWLDSGEILTVRHHEWKDFFRNAKFFLEIAKQSFHKNKTPISMKQQ
jgi:Zn-finger nucleic acid-binding protein